MSKWMRYKTNSTHYRSAFCGLVEFAGRGGSADLVLQLCDWSVRIWPRSANSWHISASFRALMLLKWYGG